MAPVRSVAVVGTGLIGASVALGARRAGVERVTGWDPDAAHLAAAAARGAVEPAADLVSALADAELAVVAAPVTALPAQVRAVLDASGPGCTVTDVGSTKGGVCAAAAGEARFIGGHPICGSEARGPERATAELFEGATWFLTPVAATEPERYRLVHGFVSALGAIPVAVDPDAHDRLVAVTSHLPHALANVLLNHAGGTRVEGHEPLAAAGGSLRDMTRIAGANPRIWVDIFLENRAALAAALAEHRRRIEQVEAALEAGDAGFLARWIGEASTAPAAPPRDRLRRSRLPPAPARPRPRPAGRDRGHRAGARRRADQHRRLRPPAPLHRARRHPDDPRHRRAGGRARAAAILETQGYGVVVAPVLETTTRPTHEDRAGGVDPRPSRRSGRQVDLASSRPPRRDRRRGDADRRLRPLGRHGDDDRGGASARCARLRGGHGDAERLRGRTARAEAAAPADRLRQRRHADAAPARDPRRPGGTLHAHRRRVAELAADGARSPSRCAGWASRSRRPTDTRR